MNLESQAFTVDQVAEILEIDLPTAKRLIDNLHLRLCDDPEVQMHPRQIVYPHLFKVAAIVTHASDNFPLDYVARAVRPYGPYGSFIDGMPMRLGHITINPGRVHEYLMQRLPAVFSDRYSAEAVKSMIDDYLAMVAAFRIRQGREPVFA